MYHYGKDSLNDSLIEEDLGKWIGSKKDKLKDETIGYVGDNLKRSSRQKGAAAGAKFRSQKNQDAIKFLFNIYVY